MSQEEFIKYGNTVLLNFFEDRLNRNKIAQAVRFSEQKSWDSFFTGLQSCVQELERLLSVYPSIISQPELLERIIKVRSDVKALYSIRIIFPDVLGIPLEQQPSPRDGDKQSSNDMVHSWAISSVDNLITSTTSARKIVDKMLEESY